MDVNDTSFSDNRVFERSRLQEHTRRLFESQCLLNRLAAGLIEHVGILGVPVIICCHLGANLKTVLPWDNERGYARRQEGLGFTLIRSRPVPFWSGESKAVKAP